MIEVMEREKYYSFNSVVSQATQLAYRIASGQSGREEWRNPFVEGNGEPVSDVIPLPREIWGELKSAERAEENSEEWADFLRKFLDEEWKDLAEECDLEEAEHSDRDKIERLSKDGVRYLECVDKGVESLWEDEDPEFFWTAAFYEPDGTPLSEVYAVRADPRFTWKWLEEDYFLLSRFAASSLEDHDTREPIGIALKWSREGSFSEEECEDNFGHYIPSIEVYPTCDNVEDVDFSYRDDCSHNEECKCTSYNTKIGSDLGIGIKCAKEWLVDYLTEEYDIDRNIIEASEDGKDEQFSRGWDKHVSDYFATLATGLGKADNPVNQIDQFDYEICAETDQICAYAFPLLIPPPSENIKKYVKSSSLAVLYIASTSPIPPCKFSDAHLISQSLAPIAADRMQSIIEEGAEKNRLIKHAHTNRPTVKTIRRNMERRGIFAQLEAPTQAAFMGLEASVDVYHPDDPETHDLKRQFPGIESDPLKHYTLIAAGEALSRAMMSSASNECERLAGELALSTDSTPEEKLLDLLGLDSREYSVPEAAREVTKLERFGVMFYHMLGQALYHSLETYTEDSATFIKPEINLVKKENKYLSVEIINCGKKEGGHSKDKNQFKEMAKHYDIKSVFGPRFKRIRKMGAIIWETGMKIEI